MRYLWIFHAQYIRKETAHQAVGNCGTALLVFPSPSPALPLPNRGYGTHLYFEGKWVRILNNIFIFVQDVNKLGQNSSKNVRTMVRSYIREWSGLVVLRYEKSDSEYWFTTAYVLGMYRKYGQILPIMVVGSLPAHMRSHSTVGRKQKSLLL